MTSTPRRILAAAAAVVLFAAGFALRGWMSGTPTSSAAPAAATGAKATVWTCSMHPQVRLPNPGRCPICEMPLIPAEQSAGNAVVLDEAARAAAGIETAAVERRPLAREIRAVGKVRFNETAMATVTARVDGYVERLFADYSGMAVDKGDHLVELYSPDLVLAQRELLLAQEDASNPARLESSKLKLLRWDVSEEQIAELLKTRKVQERVTLHSKVRGTVIEKNVVEKSPVKAGDVLYRLADLGSVWALLDLYEYELGWIQYGQQVDLAAEAFPGEAFRGMVTFISPTLDEETRSVRVRVNVANPGGRLKPGMFVSATIHVKLRADGRPAPTGVEGRLACPMHPEILADAPGACPVCGMALKLVPGAAPPPGAAMYVCEMHPQVRQAGPGRCPECDMKLILEEAPPAGEAILALPASAVLDSGTRKVAYVERRPGVFEAVEVVLGARAGDYYPLLSGLKQGDRVAVRGNFLLDSQFQIQGKPSLLNPQVRGATSPSPSPTPGHEHH